MTRILVTGATGLLGSSLAPALAAAGHDVLRHGSSRPADFSCDLSDEKRTQDMVKAAHPDLIINLAALTDVDLCEEHPDKAYVANVLSAQNLSNAIKLARSKTYILQISTDQVYDGAGPHGESDVTIRNTYALSKMAAELAVARIDSIVLRTNFVGRSRVPGRRSLSDWLFDSLSKQAQITVFNDVLFNPLSITTLCSVLLRVIDNCRPGLYNLGSSQGFSKAQFAIEFAACLGLDTGRLAQSSVDGMTRLKARRPKDMRMDCRRFSRTFDIVLPTLSEEIGLIAKEYHGYS